MSESDVYRRQILTYKDGPRDDRVTHISFSCVIVLSLLPGLLSFINCMSVRWATCVQNVFTILKTLALVIIIITGVVVLAQG